MESFFSSLETERIRGKLDRTRDAARADVFEYIEQFYNTIRRHSTIGYLSPVEFEKKVGLAQLSVHETGGRPRRRILRAQSRQRSPLKLARGANNLWTKNGLQYAPPIR